MVAIAIVEIAHRNVDSLQTAGDNQAVETGRVPSPKAIETCFELKLAVETLSNHRRLSKSTHGHRKEGPSPTRTIYAESETAYAIPR